MLSLPLIRRTALHWPLEIWRSVTLAGFVQDWNDSTGNLRTSAIAIDLVCGAFRTTAESQWVWSNGPCKTPVVIISHFPSFLILPLHSPFDPLPVCCGCSSQSNYHGTKKQWASLLHLFCDSIPIKWEMVLIFSRAHSGTTQCPAASQQSWDFGNRLLAASFSSSLTNTQSTLLHLSKSAATERPARPPQESYS